MKAKTIAVACCLILPLIGCTTDGTETTTEELKPAKKTINYTAWVCKVAGKTVGGYRCDSFHSAYGPKRSGAVKAAQDACAGNCKVLFVRQGCASLTTDQGNVLRPKC